MYGVFVNGAQLFNMPDFRENVEDLQRDMGYDAHRIS